MTKKGPMKKYLVEAEFQDIEVVVSARTEGEARDKVRKRIAKARYDRSSGRANTRPATRTRAQKRLGETLYFFLSFLR